MEPKKQESDRLRVASFLKFAAARSASMEEFGTRIYRRILQEAATTLENARELMPTIEIGLDFSVTLILEKTYYKKFYPDEIDPTSGRYSVYFRQES